MIVLGLTGSIGMGKSTTAALFAEEGVPVWDADAAVHRIYAPGGAGVAAIGELVPEAVVDGAVDRARLRDAVTRDRALLAAVERAVHPLVAADRAAFVEVALASGAAVAVCDVPLLYEIGAEDEVDAVVVVTAPAEVQRERVLARPGMTEAALDAILARQIPDAEKRARADHVIDTGRGIDHARERVREILAVERARAGMTDTGR